MSGADDLAALTALLGHAPRDTALFIEALTHGSHGAGSARGPAKQYQRLEFLGDRVLGLVMAEALYRRFGAENEGQLAARLNGLVSGETCAEVARAIGLGVHIRLGKQARDDGARDSDNVLGDVVEALIGALYLDAGLEAARTFILTRWAARIDAVREAPKHPKAALMEWAAANRRRAPDYRVVSREGPDHAPRFTVAVGIHGVGDATGTGPSKQEAERMAAAALMDRVKAS